MVVVELLKRLVVNIYDTCPEGVYVWPTFCAYRATWDLFIILLILSRTAISIPRVFELKRLKILLCDLLSTHCACDQDFDRSLRL